MKQRRQRISTFNSKKNPTKDACFNSNPESKPPTTVTFDHHKYREVKGEEKKEEKKSKRPLMPTMIFKAVAAIALLAAWLSLMKSAMINWSVENGAPQLLSAVFAGITAARKSFAFVIQEWCGHILSSPLALLFATRKESSKQMVQIEKWLESGRDLLRKYDDAQGSAALCERALNTLVGHRVDEASRDFWVSLIPSLAALLNAHENRLLSEALLCMGEASLSLFSSPYGSAVMRRAHLMEAKDSFEAATTVDPANPSIRSGLGLSYLLLGATKAEKYDAEKSVQFMFRSVQHLKAAVGLMNDATTEDAVTACTAAMHNLGLAYIALDGMSSSGAIIAREKTAHFLDWVALIRSSETAHLVMESWVFAANEGASLLQTGKVKDAISYLEFTASNICTTDPLSLPRRQKEACLIILQNLSVAREALYGNSDGMIDADGQSHDRKMIHDDVARLSGDMSSEIFLVVQSDPEPSKEKNVNSSIDGAGFAKTTDTSDEKNETVSVTEEINEAATSADEYKMSSGLELTKEAEATRKGDTIGLPSTSSGMKTVKSEMQNALTALEKAAVEGPQRSRLLLALARARSTAGNLAGAVEAALMAISAATSEEATEAATTYLEMLIERMLGEGNKDRMQVIPVEHVVGKSEKASSFVESKDLALTELQLKLELERLKYKVLEQEMMLGRQYQNPTQYTDEMHDEVRNERHNKMHAIEYQQKAENTVHDNPHGQQSEITEEKISTSKTTKKPLEHETAFEMIQVDIFKVSEPVAPTNETFGVSQEDSAGGEASTESRNSEEGLLPESIAKDDIESDKFQITAESESDVKVTNLLQKVSDVELIHLPSLYKPTSKPPEVIPPTAKSYMKMADAYLDKGQYALASKQFLKVIKKAPDHLPAHLGYATALERAGKTKQINTAALAYGNATRVAIIQSEKVDPMGEAGTGGLAENILKRAVKIAKTAPSGRLETLRVLSAYAHTAALAADTYFEVGIEITKQGINEGDNKDHAVQAFTFANEFAAIRNDTEIPYHIGSIIGLARIAFDHENDAIRAIELFNKVKYVRMEDDAHVELLVLVGRAHVSLGELETAITKFTRALSFPQCSTTPSAHYELAIALKKNNSDTQEINPHFEKALDMGMDPTSEAIETLGERNKSVVRALNRQYYKAFNKGGADRTGGGIMSSGSVGSQSTSVFAPQEKQSEEESAQSQTLTLLEQGAAAYDGRTPMGGEVERSESSLSNLKAKKQTGSESHLSELKR